MCNGCKSIVVFCFQFNGGGGGGGRVVFVFWVCFSFFFQHEVTHILTKSAFIMDCFLFYFTYLTPERDKTGRRYRPLCPTLVKSLKCNFFEIK